MGKLGYYLSRRAEAKANFFAKPGTHRRWAGIARNQAIKTLQRSWKTNGWQHGLRRILAPRIL